MSNILNVGIIISRLNNNNDELERVANNDIEGNDNINAGQNEDEISNFLREKRATFTSWADYIIPWLNMPATDILACNNGNATERNKQNLVRAVITDMRFYSTLIRRKDMEHVAKQFMIKFPSTFKYLDEDFEILHNGFI